MKKINPKTNISVSCGLTSEEAEPVYSCDTLVTGALPVH